MEINRIRLVLSVEDGVLTGKVTAHGPYATVEELVDLAGNPPEVSADVDLAELDKATVEKILPLADALIAQAEYALKMRFDEAKFTARQIAKIKSEIKR